MSDYTQAIAEGSSSQSDSNTPLHRFLQSLSVFIGIASIIAGFIVISSANDVLSGWNAARVWIGIQIAVVGLLSALLWYIMGHIIKRLDETVEVLREIAEQ